MTQRLAALALAIAIGCGGSTPPPESPEPQTEEPTEAPTTDEAPAQPAAADDYKPQQVCEHMATLIARENAKEGADAPGDDWKAECVAKFSAKAEEAPDDAARVAECILAAQDPGAAMDCK